MTIVRREPEPQVFWEDRKHFFWGGAHQVTSLEGGADLHRSYFLYERTGAIALSILAVRLTLLRAPP